MNRSHSAADEPVLGILAWENELEQLPGNLIHPDTFPFPVHVERIEGACYESMVLNPDKRMEERFARAAQRAAERGVKFIVSTTGLSVLFQQAAAQAVQIPVFTSSLLMLPTMRRLLNPGIKIGVITAGERFLSAAHLEGIGDLELHIEGIDRSPLFTQLAVSPSVIQRRRDLEELGIGAARNLLAKCPEIGLIVIEVTGLCAVAGAIRKHTGLPVLDIVECSHLMHNLYVQNRWSER
jgi:hypothetical protein